MKAKIAFQKLEDVDRQEWIQLTENAVRPYYINQEYEYAKIMESGGRLWDRSSHSSSLSIMR